MTIKVVGTKSGFFKAAPPLPLREGDKYSEYVYTHVRTTKLVATSVAIFVGDQKQV